MEQHLEHEQVERDLRAAFDRMDVRGVGRINAGDLKKAMAAQGQVLTDEDVHEMMAEADTSGTGECSAAGALAAPPAPVKAA